MFFFYFISYYLIGIDKSRLYCVIQTLHNRNSYRILHLESSRLFSTRRVLWFSTCCQPAFYVISTVYYIYQLPIQTYDSIFTNISQIRHILKYVINVYCAHTLAMGCLSTSLHLTTTQYLLHPIWSRAQESNLNNGSDPSCFHYTNTRQIALTRIGSYIVYINF